MNHKLITNVNIGEREPLHCTGIGKLFLSEMDEKEALSIFNSQKKYSMTPFSITSEERILEEISNIKFNGYATDNRESAEDIFCVAVPLRDYTGKIAAGMSMSLPAGRIEEYGLENAAQKMKEFATAISRSMGFAK